MRIFTLGIARTSVSRTLASLINPPTSGTIPGLVHAECMTSMRLGSSIFSPHRMQLRHLMMFAAWESEEAIEDFLSKTRLGQAIGSGWHLRMSFLRRWGSIRAFADLPQETGECDPSAPVVAYTLARLRIPEVPRFIRWGKPVEELVRDNPDATLALAAIRYPQSVATFSVWNSQQAMTDMVQGHSNVDRPERHAIAMKERDRRNFHHEFTTLRFKPLSEHGSWEGRSGFVRQF
ncbi:MAG: hypothetical protein K8R88_15270 [Armatimonadetes bacterium]|nr:hypothetical protein [Armatimonadota bacterium]